jgi:hypothetical protein
MRAHFSSYGGYAAELEIVESEFRGGGGHSMPQFILPLRLDAWLHSKQPRDGLEIVSLSGKLWIGGVCSISSNPATVNYLLQTRRNALKDHPLGLEFSTTAGAVADLERHRNGGDLQFKFDATLVVRRLSMLHEPPGENQMGQPVWGFVAEEHQRLQANVRIPRDTWVQQVLRGVGYGAVHILEFPAAPLEACAALDNAFQSLKQAQQFHHTGHYDDAVGKCRIALEQFFEYEDRTEKQGEKEVVRRVPFLKKSWETKLGAAAYAWLDGAFSAIKGASNRSHHSPIAHYSQLDSQMILAVTTATVAYAARAMGEENSK